MRLFRRRDDFDPGMAYESDPNATLKIVVGVIFVIALVGVLGYFGYQAYQNYALNTNSTLINNTSIPLKPRPNLPIDNETGKVIVEMEGTNFTVEEDEQGFYALTKQERVVGEVCYINNLKKACSLMTNEICAKNKCQKTVETVVECFMNKEKVDCPE